ncbi:hypothetical protein HF576_13245 [Microbacterium sp. CFH 90308]|uniref:Uncharacterized protein n=1 Tax=Microbacterium salsuginis TaxID=2722803 RepID=A0ABX1KE94_9MICO|nr:hypothetical protein [Microbacterium sp. CFH 90308]NLP84817.1 hypothetical protein [Microbacterium sp. CFH 90308]
MDATTNEVILDVLKGAAAAHGVFEAEELGGVHDDEWPEWYAAHMTNALAALGYRLVADATTGAA